MEFPHLFGILFLPEKFRLRYLKGPVHLYVTLLQIIWQIILKTYWTFPSEIIAAPFVIVAIIGVIVLAILLNRIATFNDCPEAAAELRKQIKQAKEDLSEKGIKFD